MKLSASRRFTRFFVVGASGVLVNMGALMALTEGLRLPLAFASLCAIELSILGNFAWNNAWTWSDRQVGSLRARLLKYHAVAGFSGLCANWGVLLLLTTLFHTDYRLANLLGIVAGMALNFTLNHLWTFRGAAAGPTFATRWAVLRRWWGQRNLPDVTRRWRLALLVMFAAALALRVVATYALPLVPEEAYYWMYSQHPSLSYFDHPPMVAWLIGLGTLVFNHTELGVRVAGAVLMLAASGALYVYGRMWFGRRAAALAALSLQVLPVYFGAGLVATMDSALVFFWAMCLVGMGVALRRERAWGWYLAGACLGGAMLSKYTGVFLGVGALLAVVLHRPWRRHLRTVHPYAAALLALALFSPVLVWNAQHEWASLRFQSVDRFGEQGMHASTLASYGLMQLAVATPFVLGGLVWLGLRVARSRRRLLTPRWLIAACFSLPLLLVVSYKSLRYSIHLNWTLPLYLSVFPAVAQLALTRWRAGRRDMAGAVWLRRATLATVVVCLSLNALALLYALVVQPRTGWVSALGPWHELAAEVEKIEEQLEAQTGEEPLIIADGKYRLASLLAFYRTPLEHAERASDQTTSQWILRGPGLGYPYWAPTDQWQGRDCILVSDTGGVREFARQFDDFQFVNAFHPTGHKTYQIAIGHGRHN
jgi:dolichol-phosphate mannosyltransferase